MSVERITYIGIGWIVSSEKRDKICEQAMENRGEVEDLFMPIDAYCSDSEYFIGDVIHCIGEGEYINLIDIQETVNSFIDDFSERYEHILVDLCREELTIDGFWSSPSLYIIHKLY